MFSLDISGWDIILFLLAVALVGGFGIYVALPWLWAVLVKPGLLWIILSL